MSEDEVRISIVAELDTDDVKRQTEEIGKFIEKNIGKKIENSVKIGKNERLAFFGDKNLGYSAVRYNTTSDGKVSSKNFNYQYLGSFSEDEARRLSSTKAEDLAGKINSIRKERLTIQKEEIRLQKEKIKLEKQERKTLVDTQKIIPQLDVKTPSDDNSYKSLSSAQKLLNTLKRVGFYRIARNIFRFVETGLSEGLKGLADVSPEVNKTMSSLVTNFQKLANSLTIAIYPILKLIEPLLDWITKIVMQLAEGISYLAYKLGLTAHWFKVNEEYAKDFNNQMNKFSFDKFEALSNNNSSTGNPFIQMDGEDEQAQKLADAVGLLASALGVIVAVKFSSWLSDAIPKMKSFIQKADSMNDSLSTMKLALGSIALGIGVFILMDSMLKNAPKWVSIITMVAGAIFLLATAIAMATGNLSKAIAIPMLAVGAGITIAGLKNTMAIPQYANGGLVDSGSLFIAGESGAELVTTMPSGQTGVTNVAQFKQAMLEALYEWGGGFGGEQGAVVLNLDGAEIARSKRFTGEMNRRNAGLNLR